jgi:hypothetical protein
MDRMLCMSYAVHYGTDMPVFVEPGVEIEICGCGCLEMVAGQTPERLHFGPRGTAVWIALRRHGSESGAVDALAKTWDADPEAVRECVSAWIAEFCRSGVMRRTP